MQKVRIKKDDKVVVLNGKDKGKKAKVLEVLPKEGKLVVERVNVVKKHTRPRPPKVPQGGILEKAMPIQVSKVMLICPHCSAAVRVASRVLEDGSKERYCRKCNEAIP